MNEIEFPDVVVCGRGSFTVPAPTKEELAAMAELFDRLDGPVRDAAFRLLRMAVERTCE